MIECGSLLRPPFGLYSAYSGGLVAELEVVTLELGPAMTNAYVVGDPASSTAVAIDPAWSGGKILAAARDRNWDIEAVWLTHAHFDHFGGAAELMQALADSVDIALHPEDLPLWNVSGGAPLFGFMDFDKGPEPTILLEHGQELTLGNFRFVVLHTPGHTPGHVTFHEPELKMAFCGDLVFQGSVGRTDLPGGSWETLLESIRREIFTLPDDTQLLPGHGLPTTVATERRQNPFLRELS
jgi:glyoxylase-like metal-dependent hydrolase (beta-lactamase superfamily II)